MDANIVNIVIVLRCRPSVLREMRTAESRTESSTLSWTALFFAGLAAGSFYVPGTIPLVLGAAFLFRNGLFDALDGKVVKVSGRASPRGDFLDHVFDRYADVLMLSGIVLSPFCPVWLGLLAIIGVLLTSYMGTQAQAVGLGRHYGGPPGDPIRSPANRFRSNRQPRPRCRDDPTHLLGLGG